MCRSLRQDFIQEKEWANFVEIEARKVCFSIFSKIRTSLRDKTERTTEKKNSGHEFLTLDDLHLNLLKKSQFLHKKKMFEENRWIATCLSSSSKTRLFPAVHSFYHACERMNCLMNINNGVLEHTKINILVSKILLKIHFMFSWMEDRVLKFASGSAPHGVSTCF